MTRKAVVHISTSAATNLNIYINERAALEERSQMSSFSKDAHKWRLVAPDPAHFLGAGSSKEMWVTFVIFLGSVVPVSSTSTCTQTMSGYRTIKGNGLTVSTKQKFSIFLNVSTGTDSARIFALDFCHVKLFNEGKILILKKQSGLWSYRTKVIRFRCLFCHIGGVGYGTIPKCLFWIFKYRRSLNHCITPHLVNTIRYRTGTANW